MSLFARRHSTVMMMMMMTVLLRGVEKDWSSQLSSAVVRLAERLRLTTINCHLRVCVCRESLHRLGILRRSRTQISDHRRADHIGSPRRPVGPRTCQRQFSRSQDVRQATRTLLPMGSGLQTGRAGRAGRGRGRQQADDAAIGDNSTDVDVVRVRAKTTVRRRRRRSGEVGCDEFRGAGKSYAVREEDDAHERCSSGTHGRTMSGVLFIPGNERVLSNFLKPSRLHISVHKQ